jgi:heptosyltransferase-2
MRAALVNGARLLVRVPNWLGDLVMAEPVLRCIDQNGGATLVGSPRLLSLFEGALPNCTRLYADEAQAWRAHDAALLLTGSFRSAWLAARARIPVRAGLSRDARGWLLTHAMAPAREVGGVPLGLGVHGRGRRWLPRPFGGVCVELASLLGVTVTDRQPRLSASWATRERVRARLERMGLTPGEPFVVANVGSRAGSAKGAPAELWSAMLAAFALRSSLPVALVCGPGEEDVLAEVLATSTHARCMPLVAPVLDLAELSALFAEARLLISADNGPRHLASAVGTPVAVVCGPTDPRHTADYLSRTRFVRANQECSPCHREICPLSGAANRACFTRIDPMEVARAALELTH